MTLSSRETIPDLINPVEHVRETLKQIRDSVGPLLFAPAPTSLETVTQLLAAVPLSRLEKLHRTWDYVVRSIAPADIAREISREDRLLLDMVLAMYDHRRTFPAVVPVPEVARA